MVKFIRETAGTVLVQYTLVFPLFIVVLLGTVDIAFMLYEWGVANKAAYIGARTAVVSDPVAQNITSPTYTSAQLAQLGASCFDSTTGLATNPSNCPSFSSVCTGGNNTCTNGYGWNEAAFTWIFSTMQRTFPRLTRQNVQITYQTSGLGFVGQPNGLPMNVTITIQCMSHQFYFINGLMNWTFSPPAGCPASLQGPAIPPFASTLQSESLFTQ